MDSVVCGWANDKCRGTMGNYVTFRPNTATDRSPLQHLPGHAQIRHGKIGWQSYGYITTVQMSRASGE